MTNIILKNVYLNYPVFSGDSRSFKKNVLNKIKSEKFKKNKSDILHIQALKNINLEINEGDRIGIYGNNGSGKSSLLKVISGIYYPSNGSINVEGRINSLISLNAGFNENLTGKENSIFKLKLLGLKKDEINDKLNEIKNFSGLNEFFFLPIKTYSSGMLLRLSFSLSIMCPHDILIMDEWLSVGDDKFQQQAMSKINEIVQKSKILIIASQSKNVLERLCNKILTLSDGIIISEK
jgi:lipopolysaccharide transport system ATP-binding protein